MPTKTFASPVFGIEGRKNLARMVEEFKEEMENSGGKAEEYAEYYVRKCRCSPSCSAETHYATVHYVERLNKK